MLTRILTVVLLLLALCGRFFITDDGTTVTSLSPMSTLTEEPTSVPCNPTTATPIQFHSIQGAPTATGGVRGGVKNALILVWEAPYCPSVAVRAGDPYCFPRQYLAPCGAKVRHSCRITTDKTILENASAVVIPFAARIDVMSALPSWFWSRNVDIPLIAWSIESPDSPLGTPVGKNTPYNWTMSYRQDADIPFPYIWDTFFTDPGLWKKKRRRKFKNVYKGGDTAGQEGMQPAVLGVASNCGDGKHDSREASRLSKRRIKTMEAISQRMPTLLLGRCWGRPVPEGKLGVERGRRLFHLAFENRMCIDYVSEKYWTALANGAIPVVNGLKESYPPMFGPQGAHINANDFESASALTQYLKEVAAAGGDSPYLAWRSAARRTIFPPTAPDKIGWCALCTRLLGGVTKRQVYPNISLWIDQNGTACTQSAPIWGEAWSK